jgi:hypothetical protein
VRLLGRHPPRTADRVGAVGDHRTRPPADLVAEDPEASEPPASDRTVTDHATGLTVASGNGRQFDDVSALFDNDLERRVVQVESGAPLEESAERFERFAVQPYDLAASP